MTIRIAFIAAATLVLAASSANAQARAPQRVVLSETVMKSMVANKPKSKASLAARIGMVRKSGLVATGSGQAAPTSVREVNPSSKKK